MELGRSVSVESAVPPRCAVRGAGGGPGRGGPRRGSHENRGTFTFDYMDDDRYMDTCATRFPERLIPPPSMPDDVTAHSTFRPSQKPPRARHMRSLRCYLSPISSRPRPIRARPLPEQLPLTRLVPSRSGRVLMARDGARWRSPGRVTNSTPLPATALHSFTMWRRSARVRTRRMRPGQRAPAWNGVAAGLRLAALLPGGWTPLLISGSVPCSRGATSRPSGCHSAASCCRCDGDADAALRRG